MDPSALKRLAQYLGFSSLCGVQLFFLTFILGGLALARFLPLLDRHIPGGAPITQIFLEALWFALMVFGLLKNRKPYREKYGEKAYQKIAFRFFLPAAMLMLAGILRGVWVEGEGLRAVPFWLRLILGIYCLLLGLTLEFRGVVSLGVDRIAFVYTVFPERGTRVESQLYEFLRHPIYSAMTHMALGVALLSGKLSGLFCFPVFALKIWLWSKVEEKELTQRFGESYADYRKRVPAFFPRLRRQPEYLRLLFGRDKH